jgi:Beta-1,4-xylanase
MGKKVVAILTLVALLFSVIPTAGFKTVKAATGTPITLYDLDQDTDLVVGTNMPEGTTFLQKSGGPTVGVINSYDGTKSLHLTGVANSWDAVDLKRTALMKDNTYLTGTYTFTVRGHVDDGDKASTPKFILGESAGGYGWLDNKDIAAGGDGTFTLTYTTTYANASDISGLAYDYRIQTQNGSPSSFYIDGITVTVVPTTVTPQPITLYDLNEDTDLSVGTNMPEGTTFLQKSGGPTVSVINTYDGTKSLHMTGVANSWDAVDIKRTALMKDNTYLTGEYTFTVKGHVDEADKTSTPKFILGESAGGYGWLDNKDIAAGGDGTFTLTYTTTYANATDISGLAYDYRIQTQNGSPSSFYIDDITVTVVPTADSTPPTPPTADKTLPVGTTVELYDLDKDTNLTAGGAITDSPALAKSGEPTISIVDVDPNTDADGISLYVENRTANHFGVDLKRSALMQDDSYYAGDYTFTVEGHFDPEYVKNLLNLDDAAATTTDLKFVLGKSVANWNEWGTSVVKVGSNGDFTITYNVSYSTDSLTNLGSDYRIQSGYNMPLVPFYIDDITVKVTGAAPKMHELYSVPFDSNTDSSLFTPHTNASIELANGTGIGHEDNSALQVTHKGDDYTGAKNAVTLNLPKKLPVGGTYNISAWVYIPTDANTGKGTLTGPGIVLNGDFVNSTSKFPTTPGTIATGTWQELNVTLPVSTTPISTIDFCFDTNTALTHPDVWLFDNIVISQVGDRTFTPTWDLTLPSLADAYKDAFLIGNIMEPNQITDTELTDMYKKQYNVVTAENAMKPDKLSTAKGVYDYTDADKLINWAQNNGIKVHAHTLVWHSQSAAWLNKDGSGNALTRADAKANMEEYINNVVGHFAGKVISWDVVNEAFLNDVTTAPTNWKDALRTGTTGDKNPWYAAYANGADVSKGESGADFIYDGYVFTRLADPKAKLFYNDYNETELGKYEAIGMMIEDLNKKWASDPRNTEPGRPLIEGVGMQAHYWTEDLNLAKNVEAAIQRFIKAGVDVSVSELDIPIGSYPTYKQNDEILSYNNERFQADLYKQLFEVYDKYASHIDRVTFWGKADPQS